MEKLDERSEEFESREVKIKLVAALAELAEAEDDDNDGLLSIEGQLENDFVRFEQMSLVLDLPKLVDPVVNMYVNKTNIDELLGQRMGQV